MSRGNARSRKEELKEVASRLFAERGFESVSINDIGAELGLTGPAMYHYYRSKEALLIDVLNAMAEAQLAGFAEIDVEGADPHVVLRRLVEYHVDFALTQTANFTAWRTEFPRLPTAERHRLRRTMRAYLDRWVEVVSRIHPGEDPRAVRAACQMAFAFMQSPSEPTAGSSFEGLREVLIEGTTAALSGAMRVG